jgi:hypothetical protein
VEPLVGAGEARDDRSREREQLRGERGLGEGLTRHVPEDALLAEALPGAVVAESDGAARGRLIAPDAAADDDVQPVGRVAGRIDGRAALELEALGRGGELAETTRVEVGEEGLLSQVPEERVGHETPGQRRPRQGRRERF